MVLMLLSAFVAGISFTHREGVYVGDAREGEVAHDDGAKASRQNTVAGALWHLRRCFAHIGGHAHDNV